MPTADATALGSISSPRYASATAGMPESATPASARSQSTWLQSCANARSSVSADDDKSAASIIGLRPTTSDRELANSIATAIVAVVSDRASELSAADTPNSSVKSGSTGCVQ